MTFESTSGRRSLAIGDVAVPASESRLQEDYIATRIEEKPARPARPAPQSASSVLDHHEPLKLAEVRKGEGPYQVLERLHPDWSHKKILEAAHVFKHESQIKTLKVHQQLGLADDGAAVIRTKSYNGYSETHLYAGKEKRKITCENQVGGGYFSTVEHSDSGLKSVRVGAADGGYQETNYDREGRIISDGSKPASRTGQNSSTPEATSEKLAPTTGSSAEKTGTVGREQLGKPLIVAPRATAKEESADKPAANSKRYVTEDGTKVERVDKSDGQYWEKKVAKDNSGTLLTGDKKGYVRITFDDQQKTTSEESWRSTERGILRMRKDNRGNVATEHINNDGSKNRLESDSSGNFRYLEWASGDKLMREVSRTKNNGQVEELEKRADGHLTRKLINKDGNRTMYEQEKSGASVTTHFDAEGKRTLIQRHYVNADGTTVDATFDGNDKWLPASGQPASRPVHQTPAAEISVPERENRIWSLKSKLTELKAQPDLDPINRPYEVKELQNEIEELQKLNR